MKLPVLMLRDFVETSLTAEELGDMLLHLGFEVEGIETVDGEPVLDIKVTSNRGDALCALGLAREALAKDPGAKPTALYEQAVRRFPLGDESDPAARQRTGVDIQTPHCQRYACRLFEGIRAQPAPGWIQKRLMQAGMRPINLLVDLTNYVMLELGQPMHAFDFDKLKGQRIIVRQASEKEFIVSLDGERRDLKPYHMMIADVERAVAIAGVMGGLETEVGPTTANVLLESAAFLNTSVRRTRRELGMATEASYRFERSVDPDGVVAALNRFAMLLADVDGGKSRVPGVVDTYPNPPRPTRIEVRMHRAQMLLGVEVSAEESQVALEKLGFLVDGNGEPFQVVAPSWRPDVAREEDLIEEIGRVHGYEHIPELLPEGSTTLGGVFGPTAFKDRVREALLRCGFAQTMSHTLRDRHPLDFSADGRVKVRNPHSPEMAMLRDSLLPCLAEAAHRNGSRDLHLFEIGRVFVQGERQIDESSELGLLTTGALESPHWLGATPPAADFYSLKGVVLAVGRATGAELGFAPPHKPDRRLHPTRQSAILADQGRVHVGVFGQIHPDVAEACGLELETFFAELDLNVLEGEASLETHFKPISRNPAARRDLAVLVSKEVPFASVEAAIRAAGGEVLERLWVFDVYEGAGIPEGSHSVAVAMQLRKFGDNVTEEEANRVRERAAAELAKLGATLR